MSGRDIYIKVYGFKDVVDNDVTNNGEYDGKVIYKKGGMEHGLLVEDIYNGENIILGKYNGEEYEISDKVSLENFKRVFKESEGDESPYLDVGYVLTPYTKAEKTHMWILDEILDNVNYVVLEDGRYRGLIKNCNYELFHEDNELEVNKLDYEGYDDLVIEVKGSNY